MSHPSRDQLRAVAGRFATGVTIVTSVRPSGEPCGLTANSFTSVSLEPPLVLVCVDRRANSHDCIRAAGHFAVNVLGADQRDVAELFWVGDREQRFRSLKWEEHRTGSPVLEGALAWLDCRVVDQHRAGDHTIFIGEVEACAGREGDPLLFHEGLG